MAVRAGGAGVVGVSRGVALALRAHAPRHARGRRGRRRRDQRRRGRPGREAARSARRRGLRAGPRPGPDGRCAARFASPGPGPVLGRIPAIGEMASHLPAWGDDGRKADSAIKEGARPKARPSSDQTIHECRHGPERPRPQAAGPKRPRSGRLIDHEVKLDRFKRERLAFVVTSEHEPGQSAHTEDQ